VLDGLLTILHLLAGDLQLPPALHDPLVSITEQYVPRPELLTPGARVATSAGEPRVPRPSPLPSKDRNAVAFKAQAARAIVLDADTAEVLFEKNADQAAPMASIAKLMVAIEALDSADSLDQVLTVPKTIADLDPASSVAGFKVGEEVSVRSLMTALLVASSNDAAVTLAHGLAGSEKKFVERMNARAAELGLSKTSFANATGLDAKGNESTARDLAFLLLVAERDPLIRELTTTGATSIRTESGNSYYLKPTDQLLGRASFDISAAKTGTTDDAGLSFVVLGERDGRRILTVLLDSPDRFEEAERAMQFAFDSFSWPTAGGSRVGGELEPSRIGG